MKTSTKVIANQGYPKKQPGNAFSIGWVSITISNLDSTPRGRSGLGVASILGSVDAKNGCHQIIEKYSTERNISAPSRSRKVYLIR